MLPICTKCIFPNMKWILPCSAKSHFPVLSGLLEQIQQRNYSRSYGSYATDLRLPWKETKFDGVHLEIDSSKSLDDQEFYSNLKDDVQELRLQGRHAALIKVPIELSRVISLAARLGFGFHHSKDDYSLLSLWLLGNVPSKIPHYATHQVGVSGLVLDEERQVALVVQDKKKLPMWKFPGGFSEPGEDLGVTAVREVEEETGIQSEYQSLLTFRQQHNVRFGQSDLYFICRLRALSRDITMCQDEIAKCQWMTLDDIATNKESTPLTKIMARMMVHASSHGYKAIDIESSDIQSWLDPKQSFKFFSRPIHNIHNHGNTPS